uniref:MgtE_N domain-containing protein n=1 Tax=Steinernema glaseri TaxID=37863 RepID=A0A1I8AD83_9BILA
ATLLVFGQGHRRADLAHQLGAIAQEEIQQVQHDAEAHQELERALPEAERLGGEELAALHRALGDLVAQALQIPHAQAFQAMLGHSGQHVLEALDVAGDIQLAALDVLVQRGAFLNQQRADDDHRQNRDQQAHQQRDARCQVAPPAQAQQ